MSQPPVSLSMVFCGSLTSNSLTFPLAITPGQVWQWNDVYPADGFSNGPPPTGPYYWVAKGSPFNLTNNTTDPNLPKLNSGSWLPISSNPSFSVNQLNGAIGNVTVASPDGSVVVQSLTGTNGGLSLTTQQTRIAAGGQNNSGLVRFASSDATVTITATSPNPAQPGQNGQIDLRVEPLLVQTVLDAGYVANNSAYPSQTTSLSLANTLTLGYTYTPGVWLPNPVAPGTNQISIVPGAVYSVTGLLNVVLSLAVGEAVNVGLNILNGAISPAPTIFMPSSVSVFRLANDTGAAISNKAYTTPVSVVFTAPDSLPPGGASLGLDCFVSGLLSSVSVQWLNSFSVTRLNAPA